MFHDVLACSHAMVARVEVVEAMGINWQARVEGSYGFAIL